MFISSLSKADALAVRTRDKKLNNEDNVEVFDVDVFRYPGVIDIDHTVSNIIVSLPSFPINALLMNAKLILDSSTQISLYLFGRWNVLLLPNTHRFTRG
jgi:hypothetical protein